MRKNISPDMLNYNKFPGPIFTISDNLVKSEGISLELVENYREGFKLENFQQRFSEILLKYDYILGDWSSDELRLRGFYKNEKPVKNDSKISRLEDYLKEYCNFGCAYFLLENSEPKEFKVDKEDKRPRRRDNRKRRQPYKAAKHYQQFKGKEQTGPKKSDQKHWEKNEVSQPSSNKDHNQHFTIRKKESES
ncbi:YutD family protein [Streptococcus dentapri]|uniref:YutD family protein n=1 Tax=Streptococcus dentapri TaxID=573564 RepID=A0ABV8D0N5_9STRE